MTKEVKKLAEEMYPEKGASKFKYPSDFLAYEHDTMVSRKAFVRGYTAATLRTKELEDRVKELEGQIAKYEQLVKAQDNLINLHSTRSTPSSSSNWCESCGGRNCIC